jgi:hypothetical protein
MNISIPLFSAADRFTLKGVFSSTRRLPAAARRRTEVHRVRAVRQKQRRNHPKEPLKTKQTQFPGSPNERNFCFNKELRRKSALQPPKNKPKQTQFFPKIPQNPIFTAKKHLAHNPNRF